MPGCQKVTGTADRKCLIGGFTSQSYPGEETPWDR